MKVVLFAGLFFASFVWADTSDTTVDQGQSDPNADQAQSDEQQSSKDSRREKNTTTVVKDGQWRREREGASAGSARDSYKGFTARRR